MSFFLFSKKTKRGIKTLQEGMRTLNYELSLLRYRDSGEEEIRLAYEYLSKRPKCSDAFPYEKIRSLNTIDLRYDKGLGMYYVMHKGRKPLYFPKSMKEDRIRETYRFAMEDDDILGVGYRQRNPHAYQSDCYHVEEGDILIDAGSAEGLLTLEMIEKVGKAYLVESDPVWWEPLEASFTPYKDKVEIVKGYLSGSKKRNALMLSELLENCGSHNVFVKMDIEGAEVEVLNSAKSYLMHAENRIVLSVCSYHRTADYDVLMDFFNMIGYHTEVQPGYLYTNMYEPDGIFSLRRGVIRASNV